MYNTQLSANAFLIQFNSAVPQQVLALPAEPEKRFLSPSQEVWLMQFIAKDFLNLANFGQFFNSGGDSHSQSVDGSSFHTNPISEASTGSAMGSSRADDRYGTDANSEDSHWLKVIAIDQLGVAATTLYFTFTQEDDYGRRQRHSFAVVITTPNTVGHKVALRSICDRLTHMHARVTSIFFNEDGDDYYSSSNNNNNNAANNNATNSNTNTMNGGNFLVAGDPIVGTVATGGGGGSGRNFEEVGDAYYANDGGKEPNSTSPSSFQPGHQQFLAASAAFIPHNANQNTGNDDLMQYDCYDESMGYNDIWRRELEAAVADITVWVNGNVDRHRIPLKNTMIDELRRTAATQSVTRSSRMLDWFEQILCLALSEHRIILTGDRHVVEQLLNTIALFLPDDRLLMASTQCFLGYVVPDLSFQGTTLPISKIKTRLVWFRYPVAVVDVSKLATLDRSCHYLPARESGKKVYAVFKEWRKEQIICRRTLPMSKFMHSHINPNRVISPLVQVISRRFLNFIGFTTGGVSSVGAGNSPQLLTAGNGGVGGAGKLMASASGGVDVPQGASLNANLLRGSAAGSVLGTGINVAPQTPLFNSASITAPPPASSSSTLMSVSQLPQQAAFTAVTGVSQSLSSASAVLNLTSNTLGVNYSVNSNYGGLLSSSVAPSIGKKPLLGEEKGLVLEVGHPAYGYPRPFYDAMMFFLQQWRRTLTHRALAFYQSEVQMGREERDKPVPLRFNDGDLHLLLATVEPIYSVGAALEEKASQILVANFTF